MKEWRSQLKSMLRVLCSLFQVLPHLQTSWKSHGDPSAPFLPGGHPCVTARGWSTDQSASQRQRGQDAHPAQGSQTPEHTRPGLLHSHHADLQQDGPLTETPEPLSGSAKSAQNDRGVEQRGREGTRRVMEFSRAAPRPCPLQTTDSQQDEESTPGLPRAGDQR